MDSTNEFVAYRLPGYKHYPRIIPAPANRVWMDDGTQGWANRCLPLRIANQAGWFVLERCGCRNRLGRQDRARQPENPD